MAALSLKHWLSFSFTLVCTLSLGIFIGIMIPRYSTSTRAEGLTTCTDQDRQYNQTLSNPFFYSKQQNQSIGQILKVTGNKLTIRRLFIVRDVEASDSITIIKSDSNIVKTYTSLDQIALDRYAAVRIAMVGCRLKVVSVNYII